MIAQTYDMTTTVTQEVYNCSTLDIGIRSRRWILTVLFLAAKSISLKWTNERPVFTVGLFLLSTDPWNTHTRCLLQVTVPILVRWNIRKLRNFECSYQVRGEFSIVTFCEHPCYLFKRVEFAAYYIIHVVLSFGRTPVHHKPDVTYIIA